MKKLLFPLVSVMALFCACAENEIVDSPSSDLVSFGTYVGQTTRASSVGLTELKANNFKVAASYTADATWATAGASATLNFMYNDPVKWNAEANGWKYDYMKYWPQSGNVSFFAYSPEASTNVTFVGAAEAGIPKFTYTVPDAVASQEDLLADQQLDKTRANETVNFTFSHLLSKIGFKAKLAGDYTVQSVKVTDFKVGYAASSIVNKAVYTFAADNTVSSIWVPDGTSFHTAGEQTLNTGDVPLGTTPALLNANDKFMMLLPQEVAADELTAKIAYTVSYEDGTKVDNVENIKLPACTWVPGKQYTYNFNITLTEVKFDAIDVTPWENAEVVGIPDIPADANIGLEAAAESKVEYATTGIASITHNGKMFDVEYTAATPASRAVSDVAGTLKFTPKQKNEGTESITEDVTVTMTDVLGGKSSKTFHLIQYPPLGLAQGDASLNVETIGVVFNSQKNIYSVNTSTTGASATFTVVGVAFDDKVAVTLSSSDFGSTQSKDAITFSASNTLTETSDDKSATATVTLTGARGNTRTYTINLSQVAKAALLNNGSRVAAGTIALQFKSTKDAHNCVNSYTTNASSVNGTLATTNDFTVTKTAGGVSIVPINELTTVSMQLANKTLQEGTVILTNSCGETTTYTFSATQYAVAYITRNNEVIGNNRYGFRGNFGNAPESKTFNISLGTVVGKGSWENGDGTTSSIDDLLTFSEFVPGKNSFTINRTAKYMAGVGNWRQGQISITVANAIGERISYTLLVERKGGTTSGGGLKD